jgi:hypothetical protein
MTTVYKFKAYYTDSGVGTVQDPAPTCTVINMADDSKLANAQATTASTNMPGLYSYEYSGADGLDCVAFFATTDTGCDVKQLASYVSEKITTNLNADVAGVETKVDTIYSDMAAVTDITVPLAVVDANVDAILDDMGTAGVIVASIANNAITAAAIDSDAIDADAIKADAVTKIQTGLALEATLTAIKGAGWTTETLAAIDVLIDAIKAKTDLITTGTTLSIASAVSGSTITAHRGDTLSAALENIGALTNNSKVWFTVKRDFEDADSAAIVQIEKTGGLLYINGAAGTAGNGSLTINDEASGDVTIVLAAAETAKLGVGSYQYDIQVLRSAGTPVSTLTYGEFIVDADITKATA